MKIKLIASTTCPFVQHIVTYLVVKQIQYERSDVSLNKKPDWLFKLNPKGEVPILIIDEKAFTDSTEIFQKLEETFPPKLLPQENTKEYEQIYKLCNTGKSLYSQFWSTYMSKEEAEFAQNIKTCQQSLEIMEKALLDDNRSEQTYLNNKKSMQALDIFWLPFLHRSNLIKKEMGYNTIKKFPTITQWQEKLEKENYFKKTTTADFEEAFISQLQSPTLFLNQSKLTPPL